MRRTAAVLAMGAALLSAGCTSTTDGSPTASTTAPQASALWNPCTGISSDVWHRVGVDPATLSDMVGGSVTPPDGFKLCGGHDNPWTYSVDVWSQRYGVDDFRKKESESAFTPLTVSGREGFRYSKSSDECGVVFASTQGSFSIEVEKQEMDDQSVPCDHLVQVAGAIVPLLPK